MNVCVFSQYAVMSSETDDELYKLCQVDDKKGFAVLAIVTSDKKRSIIMLCCLFE